MKPITLLSLCAISLLLFSCTNDSSTEHPKSYYGQETFKSLATEAEQKAFAQEAAQKFILTDGHVDLPYRLKVKNFRLEKEFLGIPVQSDEGDFDFMRAREGGLDAPFMSIYIPSSFQETGGAKLYADSLIDMVTSIAEAHPDKFQVATLPSQIEENHKKGIVSLPMGMENGAPIEDDINNVAYFRDRGIRYITLTHATDNQICDSSYDTTRTWNGLSPFGREVVLEMNKTGIMVDISHVSDSTFYQVMELSKAPCIASHSSLRHFTPDFERNMSDEMVKLFGEKDGVVMINFGSTFLDGKIQAHNNKKREELMGILAEQELVFTDSLAEPIIEQFKKDNPALFADVELVADHIERVIQLAGVEHVGFGSDYDGVGDSLPTGLKDVAAYPNLLYVLYKRGYDADDMEKMCSGNLFRVWNEVERVKNSM